MKVAAIAPGCLVVVSLQEPREKFWGVLDGILPAGVAVRGLDLDVFEDWLRQEQRAAERMLGPTTVFFPMHRVTRIERDETVGPALAFADRFLAAVGRTAASALAAPEVKVYRSTGRSSRSSASGVTGAKTAGTSK